MKPTPSPVTSASGTLTIGVRSVENRISEKIGASAPPKNAVLMMRTERLAAEASVERDACDDRPDIEKVLAEQAEAQHEKESRDRCARHLRARAPVDKRPGKRQQACAHTTPANSADAEIVGEQRVAGGQDRAEAAQNVGRGLNEEAENDKGGGVGCDDAQDQTVGRQARLMMLARPRHVSSAAIRVPALPYLIFRAFGQRAAWSSSASATPGRSQARASTWTARSSCGSPPAA